ncbi:MAG: hypothetical protein HYU86_11315 [Chloroflexi bacterium]|nr:hypothetical protein [Chloroflexota bacterium]
MASRQTLSLFARAVRLPDRFSLFANWGRWLALGLLWLPVVALPGVPSASPLPQYYLWAQLDYLKGQLVVWEKVTYNNQTLDSLSEIVFNVTPAVDGNFRLVSAQVEGQEVAATLKGADLEVPLPQPLARKASVTVNLAFELTVPWGGGRFGRGQDIMALGNWVPLAAPYRSPRFATNGQPLGWARHPLTTLGDPFFSQVADFDVTLVTALPLVVASSGQLVRQEGNTWVFSAPRARDFTLALSPRYRTQSVVVDGVTITAYYLPEEAQAGRQYVEAAGPMLSWLSKKLRPYPYPSLAIAQVEPGYTSLVGQEYPALIFISGVTHSQGGGMGSYLSYLLFHEVAHQWLYGVVGNDQVYEPWLDEAMATWLALHYVREKEPSLFPYLWQGRVAGSLGSYPMKPVNRPLTDFTDEGYYTAMVYRRGAQFVEELYQTLGQETFFAFLRDYVVTFRDRLATGNAFLDMAQARTAINLNPIFARYFTYQQYQEETLIPSLTVTGGEPVGLALSATASRPLDMVRFYIDDGWLASSASGELTLLPEIVGVGEHLLTVVVQDASGANAQVVRLVTVPPSPRPPETLTSGLISGAEASPALTQGTKASIIPETTVEDGKSISLSPLSALGIALLLGGLGAAAWSLASQGRRH